MQVSNINSSRINVHVDDFAALTDGTTKELTNAFNETLTIHEATPSQHEFVDKVLRGNIHGWGSMITPDTAEARRKYLREELGSIRPDSKILVMVPKSCPTTCSEILCTVSMHRREILLAGGGKGPRSIPGFVIHGLVVPPAIRKSGHATAMIQRLIENNCVNSQVELEHDLHKWLRVGEPEVFFSWWFNPTGMAATLWNRVGAQSRPEVSSAGFDVTIECDRAEELRPDVALLSARRKLSVEETIQAINTHNELSKRQWYETYKTDSLGKDLTTQMLAPLEDFICRVRLREWSAQGLGIICPTTWGIELHEPGNENWAYLAFAHCFEERRVHVISYHAEDRAALHTLLYLACTADDVVTAYQPDHVFIHLIREDEFDNAPDSAVSVKVATGLHRGATITGSQPGVLVTDVGLRLHEQNVRYC